MKLGVASVGVIAVVLAMPAGARAASDSSLGGVVRDAHGVPQMGALVELLGPDASLVARAFTDEHGRYLLRAVLPGHYEVRASAAFLVPVLRDNLHLHAGMRSVADFTMTALFEAGAWLPTERRNVSEPTDDWRWALRSTANRPMLRLAADDQSESGSQVSSSQERRSGTHSQGQIAMLAGDGAFGEGGAHQVISLNRATAGGDVSVMQADLGNNASSGAGNSVMVAAGLERQRAWGGDTRVVVSFASHPEIQSASGAGYQVLRTATTEKLVLGDAVMVDAGTLFTAERLLTTRMTSMPYLRVAYRATPEWTLEYRLATNRALQQSRDLDSIDLPQDALSDQSGRPLLKKGLHQEIAAVHAADNRAFTVAVYHDHAPIEEVQGTGLLSADDLLSAPALADPITETLRLGLRGFSTNGVRVAWTETFSPVLSACVEGETGTALAFANRTAALSELNTAVRPRSTAALVGAVHVKTRRSGTDLEARYRWQALHTLTQVDEFDSSAGEAYATVKLRQRVWSGRRLKGINAVVEATNLLAQGYLPVVGGDGQTLFLAQVPRAVQGGLAFSF